MSRQPADANQSRPVRQHSGDRSAHTPGPWRVLNFFDSRKGLIAVASPNDPAEHICDVFPFGNRPGGAERELEQHRANARLIAAAPDMLAALEVITAHAPDAQAGRLDHFYEAVEVCRAAIAKATGA